MNSPRTPARHLLVLAGALAIPTLAHAAQFTLKFEGMQDSESILTYYAGGSGSLGSTGGPNHGVTFSINGRCGVDNDVTGNNSFGGDTANEPSGNGSLYWHDLNTPTVGFMNVPAGFQGLFGMMYSTVNPGTMTIHAGLNGTGPALAVINLITTPQINPGDPTGMYTTWYPASAPFVGTARSVRFDGVPFELRFDDVCFGIPTPGTATLLAMGILSIARHRR